MQTLEDDHRQISLGYREPPKPCECYRDTPLAEILAEDIAWGKAQGGRNGYPWNKVHLSQNITLLTKFWPEQLQVNFVREMNSILSGVEKYIQFMLENEISGKSIKNRVTILQAFCNWCVKHDYLAGNPLKKLKLSHTEPTFKRRALTFHELQKIVNLIIANPDQLEQWHILCIATCGTGVHRNALKNLTRDDLNVEKCQIHLKASTAKNRKESYRDISEKLTETLRANYESGKPKRLYAKWYNHKSYDKMPPENALLVICSYQASQGTFQDSGTGRS